MPADPAAAQPVGHRVLVVGDSVALTLGRGIERWGAANGIAVMNAGALGCSLQDDDLVRGYWGVARRPDDPCRSHETWPHVLDTFAPDTVVVLFGAWDVYDASWDSGQTWHAPGDDEWDRHYEAAIEDAATRLSANGARIVWLTPPCFRARPGSWDAKREWYDPARVDTLRVLAERVAARNHMQVSRVLTGLECPTVDLAGRPDGVHYSDPGADRAATALAPDLLAARVMQSASETSTARIAQRLGADRF